MDYNYTENWASSSLPLRDIIVHGTTLAVHAVGVFMNFVTLCAILAIPALRKSQNIFTFSLALADFLVALCNVIALIDFLWNTVTPFSIELLPSSWMLSLLSTLAIAVHRLIVLRIDTFGSQRLVTAKRLIAVCMAMWFVVITSFTSVFRYVDSTIASYGLIPIKGTWFTPLVQSATLLLSLNGVLNPAIYWLRLTEFRRQLTKCCSRAGTNEKQSQVTVSSNVFSHAK
ncbi:uncharacterized protein [Diadema antillarum]|uniref:uncharacterized protein n=1 Tax=Diadema antillarum TaxID=105358 RepID=UPI003A89D045